MNAEEKLRFEVLAGRFGNLNDWIKDADKIADYSSRLENVMRGVDTYWLKVPLRTGYTHEHSINVDGGQGGVLYQIGGNFRNQQGVMKGSSRQTFGGNMRLQYRPNSKVNVVNSLTVGMTTSEENSFASVGFKEFVNANPYFRMTNPDGTIPRYLDTVRGGIIKMEEGASVTGTTDFANPYYNASLDSKSVSKLLDIANRTYVDWTIIPDLVWRSTVILSTSSTDGVVAKDPRHTDFDGIDTSLQGSYASNHTRRWKYDISTQFTYTASIDKIHNFSFNGRTGIRTEESELEGYESKGFPAGVPMIPSYSYGFPEGSRPTYIENVDRYVSFLGALSYNYKLRYLLDLTLSNDGSTVFGRNNPFQSFWSVGVGWNVTQEEWAKKWKWLNYMKIRATYGITGNQNVSERVVSSNVYTYFPGNDVFGAAARLSAIANPDLSWQVVANPTAGIEFTAFGERLNVVFDIFRKTINPMVLQIDQKPSSGVSDYPINLGYQTTDGLEFSASYRVFQNATRDIFLSARMSGLATKGEYGGFADALNVLNNRYKEDESTLAQLNPNSLIEYRDGNSPTALTAVPSLGIDPTTGSEVYLSRFGTPTFDYDPADRVVIADSNPDLTGTVGFTFGYKNLTATFNFRYSIGGYVLNKELFQKVENINSTTIANNQDRRALYDRWAKSGDISEFKSIKMITNYVDLTPLSSRFIQRNDIVSGESANISYSVADKKWLSAIGMKYLTVTVSYRDIFFLSSVKRERSTQYPFARTVNMGISTMF
jgi:hypothetical protein